jgi:copper chaperone CopZ
VIQFTPFEGLTSEICYKWKIDKAMRTWSAYVENLKCGGCEKTVKNLLMDLEGVASVNVNADIRKLDMHYEGHESIEEKAKKALHRAGYAPVGESTLRDKAVSYISCMKGKLTKD